MKKTYRQKLTEKTKDSIMGYIVGILLQLSYDLDRSIDWDKYFIERMIENEIGYALHLLEKRLEKSVKPYVNWTKKLEKMFAKEGYYLKYNPKNNSYELIKTKPYSDSTANINDYYFKIRTNQK